MAKQLKVFCVGSAIAAFGMKTDSKVNIPVIDY
jgi:hypothetical protein